MSSRRDIPASVPLAQSNRQPLASASGASPDAVAVEAGGSARGLRVWEIPRRGLALLPRKLRRGVLAGVCASVGMAIVEAVAFLLLFALIKAVAEPDAAGFLSGYLGGLGNDSTYLQRLGGLTLLVFVIRAIGSLLLIRLQARVQAEADAVLSTRIFSSFLGAPYSALLGRNTSETVTTIAYRVPDVAANSIGAVIMLAAEVAVLSGVLVTLIALQPLLAGAVLGYFLVVSTVLLKILTPSIKASASREALQGNAAQRLLQEGLTGYKAIKANEGAEHFRQGFLAARTDLRHTRQQRVFLSRLPAFYLETSLFLGLALLAVVVFSAGREGAVTTFGVLVAAALRALPSVNRVVGALAGVRGSEVSLRAVEAELAYAQPASSDAREQASANIQLKESLQLDHVSFQYPGAAGPALEDISLVVRRGSAIGLVGGSGAGKTTLVDLALGLLTPSAGRLLVDGQPLAEQDLPGWRRSIGYVPQDVFLLDASLRENILFGRQLADEAWLGEVLRIAHLDQLVQSLPQGLDTRLGERGSRLSGGQRQRIGIARALVHQPSLLILDEATSALDNKTEAVVSNSLRDLRGQTTTLVIAHRLSTVKECDVILLLDQGRLIAAGSFSELRRSSSIFENLVRLGDLSDAD